MPWVRLVLLLLSTLGIAATAAFWLRAPLPEPDHALFELPAPHPVSAQLPWSERHVQVSRGQNITQLLGDQGIGPTQARAVIEAAKPHGDLVKVRAGETLTFRWAEGRAQALVKSLDPWNERLLVVQLDEEPHGSVEHRHVQITPVTAAGEVHYTLWDTGISMGLRPGNLVDLAAIFAWDIDFNTEIQQGDRFRLVIEEVRDRETGALVRYGSILAAEFHRSSGEVHVAYRYVGADGVEGFFDARGESSSTPFLKSPLEFSQVSSRFGRRFHPVLKRWRAHRGTDYAATTGTPVRTVGDGVVNFVGTKGGYGRHVRVKHDDQHESSYSHLSATPMRVGQRVKQGDVIGKVGSTGLATGPHLHFEFYVDAKQIDYGTLEFERTQPISDAERPGFEALLSQLQPLLEGTPLPRSTCEPPLPAR